MTCVRNARKCECESLENINRDRYVYLPHLSRSNHFVCVSKACPANFFGSRERLVFAIYPN